MSQVLFMLAKFIKLLLFLLIFSIPLGQFGRVPGLDPTIGIYLSDLVLGLFVFAAFIYLLVKRGFKFYLPISLLVVFTIWALATLVLGAGVLNWPQFAISSLYWVRLLLFTIFFIEIYSLRKISPDITNDLMLWIVASGVILAIIGFVQLIAFPDFGRLDPSLGWDPHLNRLNSSFFDPNFTGAYLVLCAALLVGITNNEKRGTRFKIVIRYSLIAILLTAIFLTFSRSAWLMLAIVVFIYGLFKARWLLLISILVAFGAYFAVPRVQTRLAGITDPADSAQFRIASWQEGFKLSSSNLLTGVGFNSLRYAKDASEFYDYRPDLSLHSGAGFDSSLLVVLATTGIPGLLIFAAFYLSGLARAQRTVLIAAVLAALLVESNFINSLFYAPIMTVEAAILGLFVD